MKNYASKINKKFVAAVAILALVAGVAVGCSTDADVASQNLSKAADQFEIDRRIVFLNGITDEYILVVEGRCSILDQVSQLEVVCKTGDGLFVKHFLGLSDNVTYFAEQLEPAEASTSRYRVVFKPSTIIPNVEN